MPKGIKKSANGLDRVSKLLVSPGLKVFPGTESDAFPDGIPLPDGVRVRTDKGVEIRFMFRGERLSETVRGRPTVKFVLDVAAKRDRIQQLIGLGKFGDSEYAEEFPESQRTLNARRQERDVLTVGKALDEWYENWKNTVGENSRRDNKLIIRNQLKLYKFPDGVFHVEDFVPAPCGEELIASLSQPRHLGGPLRPFDPNDFSILGNLPLASLTDVHIGIMRNSWVDDGLSVKRIALLLGPLRGVFGRQVALKKLDVDPFTVLKPLKQQRRREERILDVNNLDDDSSDDDQFEEEGGEDPPDPFTDAEIHQIISAADSAMANQITFNMMTGLRTGELIALRTRDIDWESNRIHIRRSLSRKTLKLPKNGKTRWVDLLPPARAAIVAQIELCGAPGGWVFPNPNIRERWSSSMTIRKRWITILKRAGVRYRRPYQMRHTYGSMMLSAGENILYVAHQMGHADWSMLVKTYGRWIPPGGELLQGQKVAAAHANDWAILSTLLQGKSAC